MLAYVDNILNRVTMYRLVLYVLATLVAVAGVFGFFGILPYSPADLAFSTVVILGTCWVTNTLFARGFNAATNVESVYITALILVLLISPVSPTSYAGVGFLLFASAWAMASKYLFAIGNKHLFNPAAFGVALSALVIGEPATWWVGGNLALLPFVFIGGLLIVRKLRRSDLVYAFGIVALLTATLTSGMSDFLTPVTQTLLHSPFFFFAFIMLVEPLTMPPDRLRRILYGALVGFLFAPNIHIGSFYLTPELALLFGNLFSYIVSPKGRFMLELVARKPLGNNAYEYVFASDRPLSFKPGQYLEWTLPHENPDNRGNRRFFTIASAPGERTVNLGVKFYDPASSFKRALGSAKLHATVSASHISGDFTLPKDPKRKLVFIAGGIGITPFASMLRHMLNKNEVRPVTLFYANQTVADIAYRDVLDRAQSELGIRTVHTLANEPHLPKGMYGGMVNSALIAREVPDFAERTFYISGPHGMVDAFKKALRGMGVPRSRIKADYFPGYA